MPSIFLNGMTLEPVEYGASVVAWAADGGASAVTRFLEARPAGTADTLSKRLQGAPRIGQLHYMALGLAAYVNVLLRCPGVNIDVINGTRAGLYQKLRMEPGTSDVADFLRDSSLRYGKELWEEMKATAGAPPDEIVISPSAALVVDTLINHLHILDKYSSLPGLDVEPADRLLAISIASTLAQGTGDAMMKLGIRLVPSS